MKLKKIEIVGFKSFLDKTKVEFPPGISAIVGPNGCGKSNIVDALRWAMGEQSAKQLRGKSMEDVIFAGSDGKAPINMAEVSITLENDGTAPEELSDYTEIMVTRRVYRSGERDYFMNKTPCRLKDIQNLFLGSGIGKKPFAIIKQGNVGAIAEATPEERRTFIEEAAGVTRYKNRKDEALRKMKSTKENLLRVKDIIAEVKRQMNSLQRQAKRAERYKNYKTEIKRYDIFTSLFHYDNRKGRMNELSSQLEEHANSEMELDSKLKQVESEIETIKLEQLEKNQKISQQKSKLFETQRTIDKLENNLTHYKDDIKRLNEEIDGLAEASENLRAKNNELETEITTEKERNHTLNQELTTAKFQHDNEKDASKDLQEELAQLNETLKSKNKNYMDLVANEARYKSIYQNAANSKETLDRRLKKIDEETVVAEKKVQELTQQEQEAQRHLESYKKTKEEIDQSVRSVKNNLETKQNELDVHIRKVQQFESDHSKIKSTYDTLKKMDDNFEWYKDGIKAIMQEHADSLSEKGDTIPNDEKTIHGIMADILTPEKGYETAVESVLGDSLQYILVKDQPTGTRLINQLRENNSGRGGFIPVSSIRSPHKNKSSDGIEANPLLNHVTVEPDYQDVIQSFLGNILVSDTLDEAITIWGNTNRNGDMPLSIVTKTGDIISPSGVLIGGSKDQLTGILLKKQEIKQLEEQLAETKKQVDRAYEEQKSIETAIQELRQNRNELIQEREYLVEDETHAEKELYKAREELKHGKRHFEIVSLEQDQILGEASDIEEQMNKYKQALEKISEEVRMLHNDVRSTNGKIKVVSSQLESFNDKIVNLRLSLTELGTKFENSSQTLKRLNDFLSDGRKRLEDITREINEKAKIREIQSRNIEESDKQLLELYDSYKQMQLSLESDQNEYRSVSETIEQNEKTISKVSQDKNRIRKLVGDISLEKSELQMKQDTLSNTLFERYHHPVSELRGLKCDELTNSGSSISEIEKTLNSYKSKLAQIGDVNLSAISEYEQHKERFDFLATQEEDLEKAMDDLHQVIRKTNKVTRERFLKTVNEINNKLIEVFPKLFEGGSARLEMTEPDKPLETGIELMIHPPGKKVQQLSLLSGGEKALSSIAFIFSIFLIRPTSFCIMDEIDAPLDDANVVRFNNLLKLIGEQSQIIMITHNKGSMEFADTLFGVTMEKKGISKIVSVNFEN